MQCNAHAVLVVSSLWCKHKNLQRTVLRSFTTQVYLNGDGLEGGETTFFADEGNEQCKICPSAGLVVLFDHDILHEGSPVRQGRKYVIRSDIMYSCPAPLK